MDDFVVKKMVGGSAQKSNPQRSVVLTAYRATIRPNSVKDINELGVVLCRESE
jgi:hypothetical protein